MPIPITEKHSPNHCSFSKVSGLVASRATKNSDGGSALASLMAPLLIQCQVQFPMAFTTTMLSWSSLEYGKKMGPELQNSRVAIRWATDYLLKCVRATPGKLYVGVGDPNGDRKCWERPEDMDTPRTVYSVSASNPGSDVAGETAAALASSSMVFRKVDPKYSRLHFNTEALTDELVWGAAWLHRATKNPYYTNLIKSLGGEGDQPDIFSWDNKYAGAYVLLSRQAILNKDNNFETYKQAAENFMCKILPNSPSSSTKYTKGT
ncbi:unnamed protein product [Arabis nemorensis]|uniref:cellulase n=1 Tax=Arabis nemorensis TaxID=586526 RepID=A0A565AZV5_9BRAS|nr:unnamed protein product [Arabis nemorensis]